MNTLFMFTEADSAFVGAIDLCPILASSSASAAEASETSASLFQLILQGGWAMIPLGLTSVFLFYLIILTILQSRQRNFIVSARIGDASETQSANGEACHVHQAFGQARQRLECGFRPAEVEQGVADDVATVLEPLQQKIAYLNVVAAVAPMIGLLGTVSGMIGAFQKIGYAGMGKPEELAGNIGEALITTATGLVIAIPAMVAFFALRHRCRHLEMTLIRFILDGLPQMRGVEKETAP